MSATAETTEPALDEYLVRMGCPKTFARDFIAKLQRALGEEWERLSGHQRERCTEVIVWTLAEQFLLLMSDETLKRGAGGRELARFDWDRIAANVAGVANEVVGATRQRLAAIEAAAIACRDELREAQELRDRLYLLLNQTETEGLLLPSRDLLKTELLGDTVINDLAIGKISAEVCRSWNNALHLLKRAGIWATWWDVRLEGERSYADGAAFFREVETTIDPLPIAEFPLVPQIRAVLRPTLHTIDPGIREELQKQMVWKPAW